MGGPSHKNLCEHRGQLMSHIVMIESPLQLQALLDLADDPRWDVQTTTDHGSLAVVVSDELYERYEQYNNLSESSPPEEPRKRAPNKRLKVQLPGQE